MAFGLTVTEQRHCVLARAFERYCHSLGCVWWAVNGCVLCLS